MKQVLLTLAVLFHALLIVQTQKIHIEKPCKLDKGEGECVPYYLCSNGSIITDGANLLDIRNGVGQECDDYLEQCCAIADINKELSTNLIPDGYMSNGMGGVVPIVKPDSGAGCDGMSGHIGSKPQHKCGVRHEKGIGFSLAGESQRESEFGEFPWVVAIIKEDTAVSHSFQCGGSLINSNIVLTAAHCVQGSPHRQLKVRAGEWDTQTKNEMFPHSDYNVNEIVIHPEFEKANLRNDIALLFLSKPVEDQPHIGTVCLPPQGHVFDGSRCFASGWGKDVFGNAGKAQAIMKKVELPIVANSPCQESFRTTRLGKRYELHKSFICAGGEPGKDTCTGDGGSSLVCAAQDKPGSYYQAGIVAWGIGCGEQGIPGAYVNVALFRDWIDKEVQSKGFNPSSYTA